VVRARDDAEGGAPDGDAHPDPIAALGNPAAASQPDAGDDRDEQRQPA
jgi:hypothetical protein